MPADAAPENRAPPVVVGGGPASAALVVALARRGARPTVIDPRGLSSSPNTICAFADQLPAAFIAEHFARTVVVTEQGEVDLDRPYARLDGAALAEAARAGADVVVDTVSGHRDEGRIVVAGTGAIAASIIVDASGHTPVLVQRARASSSMQSAYGLVVRGADDALPPGTALFMDWRSSGVDDGGPPSFLYALASDDGRLLLEETTLASDVVVAPEVLKARLLARVRRRGTRIDEVVDDEIVAFPMSGGLAFAGQPLVAFGAAAGFVQPISGYSVARSFAAADVVADAVVAGLAAELAPAQIAASVQAQLWSTSALRLRALQQHGLSSLCAFDVDDCDAFFAAFFALPSKEWRGFLDGTSTLDEAQRTMWRVFRESPARVRARLARGAGVGRTIQTVVTYARAGLGRDGGRA